MWFTQKRGKGPNALRLAEKLLDHNMCSKTKNFGNKCRLLMDPEFDPEKNLRIRKHLNEGRSTNNDDLK